MEGIRQRVNDAAGRQAIMQAPFLRRFYGESIHAGSLPPTRCRARCATDPTCASITRASVRTGRPDEKSPAGEEDFLLELLTERVPPGVDEAAYVKAGFLSALATGETSCPLIDRQHAIRLLGDMHGGYNISTLIGLLDDAELGAAADELKHTLLGL